MKNEKFKSAAAIALAVMVCATSLTACGSGGKQPGTGKDAPKQSQQVETLPLPGSPPRIPVRTRPSRIPPLRIRRVPRPPPLKTSQKRTPRARKKRKPMKTARVERRRKPPRKRRPRRRTSPSRRGLRKSPAPRRLRSRKIPFGSPMRPPLSCLRPPLPARRPQ